MVGPEVKLLWERDGVPEFYLIKESSVGMKIKKRIRKSRMVYISPKKYSQGIWALFTRLCEAKAPILWPPDVKSRLTGKDPDAGKDWRQKEKWTTEDEMIGWHCQFNVLELGQTPGDNKGQRGLVCFSPWCLKESGMTQQQQQKYKTL